LVINNLLIEQIFTKIFRLEKKDREDRMVRKNGML